MLQKSHSLSIGIVGLPNSGKSTLFNSITQNSVPAENFPFCTIDKNVGMVEIPDRRLNKLANFYNTEKTVPGLIKFVDIAGLVKGASKGEGLGNQFLAHIREVDVILYVLRAFESENIAHVYNRVEPFEDFQIVQSELILKDIEVLERYSKDKEVQNPEGCKKILELLDEGIPIIEMDLEETELKIVKDLSLLSSKKRLFLLNIREGISNNLYEKWTEGFKNYLNKDEIEFLVKVDVKMVGELMLMNEDEKKEFLSLLETKPVDMGDIIELAYKKLDLITFYTGNEKECNAWSIVKNSNVKEAAGVIHTDLSQNFITADVVNVEEMIDIGGWVRAKEKGLVKNYSKDYIVKDGDYVLILARV